MAILRRFFHPPQGDGFVFRCARFGLTGSTLIQAAFGLLLFNASGCAAMKAAQQPDKKDLTVLREGTPRTRVIAELGEPTHTDQPASGQDRTDVFSFKQGYSKGVKVGRVLGHCAADVVTWGLWEVIGIPAETLANGTDVQVAVRYDGHDEVQQVEVFKGLDAFEERQGLLARKSKSPSNARLASHRTTSRRSKSPDALSD